MSLQVAKLPRPKRGRCERRFNRSNHTATALELALTSSANRSALDAVFLVDDAGLLVSKSATPLDLTMLAAVTPIVGRGKAVPKIHRNGQRTELTVRPLDVEGEILYVAALGGQPSSRRREIQRSLSATQRIFAA